MDPKIEEAEKDVLEKYKKVKEDLGKVYVAFEELGNATAFDDISTMLDDLESVIKNVRTGGVLGRGANSHRRAREKWLEAGGQAPE